MINNLLKINIRAPRESLFVSMTKVSGKYISMHANDFIILSNLLQPVKQDLTL